MQSTTRQQLEEMQQMGGKAFVDEVIDLFFLECEMRFSKLESALEDGDLAEVGRLFHMIKGSAASTGTMRLHRISTIGELAGEQGEGDLASRSCRLGIKELKLLKATFKDWKQGISHENTAG
jgi:HPt (histidine-containing phosphotransfer) domain-containing protein